MFKVNNKDTENNAIGNNNNDINNNIIESWKLWNLKNINFRWVYNGMS